MWTSTKITFQLGAAAQTGDIVVNVMGKGASNGLPFTVRAGNIFFVSAGGDDTHADDISCPNGRGLSGCVTGGPTQLSFYGNVVHDAAANVATIAITKYYHGVYWGTNQIDMGWSVIENGKTCRAVQFHDTGGGTSERTNTRPDAAGGKPPCVEVSSL